MTLQTNNTAGLDNYFQSLADIYGLDDIYKRFEDNYCYSDGIKLHLDVIRSNPSKPTIVLVPGAAIYALCYAELMYKLSELGYNIVGFDPRGHGRSGGERGDFTISEIIRDTQAVITYAIENVNDNVILLGSSQGGIAAFYSAILDDRIEGVICQNFADLNFPEQLYMKKYPRAAKLFKHSFLQFANWFPNFDIELKSYLPLDKELIRHFGNVQNFIDQDPLALKTIKSRALRSFSKSDQMPTIDQIKCPLLVLQAEHDHFFPKSYTQSLLDQIKTPNQLEYFEGLSQTMLTENVDQVLPSINNWLRQL